VSSTRQISSYCNWSRTQFRIHATSAWYRKLDLRMPTDSWAQYLKRKTMMTHWAMTYRVAHVLTQSDYSRIWNAGQLSRRNPTLSHNLKWLAMLAFDVKSLLKRKGVYTRWVQRISSIRFWECLNKNWWTSNGWIHWLNLWSASWDG